MEFSVANRRRTCLKYSKRCFCSSVSSCVGSCLSRLWAGGTLSTGSPSTYSTSTAQYPPFSAQKCRSICSTRCARRNLFKSSSLRSDERTGSTNVFTCIYLKNSTGKAGIVIFSLFPCLCSFAGLFDLARLLSTGMEKALFS